MKHTLITAVLTSLLLSTTAFSQDETVNSDDATQTKERNNRGDNNRSDNKRRNNGELSSRALRVIDTDEDGQVSVEEYMAHAQQRFNDLDLDGNNFVTSEEAKEASEVLRERQREARSELNNRRKNSETNSTGE